MALRVQRVAEAIKVLEADSRRVAQRCQMVLQEDCHAFHRVAHRVVHKWVHKVAHRWDLSAVSRRGLRMVLKRICRQDHLTQRERSLRQLPRRMLQ